MLLFFFCAVHGSLFFCAFHVSPFIVLYLFLTWWLPIEHRAAGGPNPFSPH